MKEVIQTLKELAATARQANDDLKQIIEQRLGPNYPHVQTICKLRDGDPKDFGFVNEYLNGKIPPTEYVRLFNLRTYERFKKIENVIGKDDFVKLFDAEADQLQNFIDKDTFIKSEAEWKKNHPND
jgi:hypothetical protein